MATFDDVLGDAQRGRPVQVEVISERDQHEHVHFTFVARLEADALVTIKLTHAQVAQLHQIDTVEFDQGLVAPSCTIALTCDGKGSSWRLQYEGSAIANPSEGFFHGGYVDDPDGTKSRATALADLRTLVARWGETFDDGVVNVKPES